MACTGVDYDDANDQNVGDRVTHLYTQWLAQVSGRAGWPKPTKMYSPFKDGFELPETTLEDDADDDFVGEDLRLPFQDSILFFPGL